MDSRARGTGRLVAASWGLLGLLRYDIDIPSHELANRLAEEASVMLAPGASFDQERRLRIGLGADPETFRDGLARTAAFIEQFASERR